MRGDSSITSRTTVNHSDNSLLACLCATTSCAHVLTLLPVCTCACARVFARAFMRVSACLRSCFRLSCRYAANKLQQRLPLSQALIRPLDKSRLQGLSRQLGLSNHIVHMKFENKRLQLNSELRERYATLTSFGAGEFESSSEGDISDEESL